MIRVVSVRTHRGPCIYVGRTMPGRFVGHPLANPFRVRRGATVAEMDAVLHRYAAWLDALPDRDEQLARLAEEIRRTGRPLGCWCGSWPEDPDLRCHAVTLAQRVSHLLGGLEIPSCELVRSPPVPCPWCSVVAPEPWTGRLVPCWLCEDGRVWSLAGVVSTEAPLVLVADNPRDAEALRAKLRAAGYSRVTVERKAAR
jgi:hypothetical protein